MILVIDNYDSFVHNLARLIRLLGLDTRVVRNDAVEIAAFAKQPPEAIVISPGPCTPQESGDCLELVTRYGASIPMLGVCLGHQIIGQAMGAEIIQSGLPMHGRRSDCLHFGSPLFNGIPKRFTIGRYHSLIIQRNSLPPPLQITSETEDGTIMSIEHPTLPLVGLQFHPESILTQFGMRVLYNFFMRAGISNATFPGVTIPNSVSPS